MPSRHERRDVTGRSFSIHLRSFAPDISKMIEFIRTYRKIVSDILFDLKGKEIDRKMGIVAMSKEIYQIEKDKLNGLQAYMREKKVFMKYLGLIRADLLATTRMERFLRALDEGKDFMDLLRDYGLKAKIACPQIRSYEFKKGQMQASWANYRVRPLVMILYAIRKAEELGVDADTDDIVLSALRFYPPHEVPKVTEGFLRREIDRYFEKKKLSEMDYEREFRSLYCAVLEEQGLDPERDFELGDFKQKCRNSANNAWCVLIFLANLGLIEADDRSPTHWSSTQQRYGRTWSVAYQMLELTELGKKCLAHALTEVPIWWEDLRVLSPLTQDQNRLRCHIENIVSRGFIESAELEPNDTVRLRALGIQLLADETSSKLVSKDRPLFEAEYDIP